MGTCAITVARPSAKHTRMAAPSRSEIAPLRALPAPQSLVGVIAVSLEKVHPRSLVIHRDGRRSLRDSNYALTVSRPSQQHPSQGLRRWSMYPCHQPNP